MTAPEGTATGRRGSGEASPLREDDLLGDVGTHPVSTSSALPLLETPQGKLGAVFSARRRRPWLCQNLTVLYYEGRGAQDSSLAQLPAPWYTA